MFTPTIDLQILTNALLLRVTDTTGPDTGDGTKWDGVAGLDSTLVSAATLEITDPDGNVLTVDVEDTIDTADPITGNVVFPDQTSEWVDGYYYVIYNIWMAGTVITKFEDYSGTIPNTVKVTSGTHLLETGMKTTITGTTNYNGSYDIIKLDANTFYITKTFVSDDATGTSTPLYSNTFSQFIYTNAKNAVDRMYQIFSAMEPGNESDDFLKQCNTALGLLKALESAIDVIATLTISNIYERIIRILDYNSIELTYS